MSRSRTEQPELFDRGAAAPLDVAASAADWSPVASRLPRALRMGTSSWSFPGWSGRVWDRELPQSRLAKIGLPAYARHPLLRAVAIDRGYYGPVPFATLRKWRDQVPADFRFLYKADRRLLFPDGPDSDPDLYLNPVWAAEEVVEPVLEALSDRLGSILFQFPPLAPHRVDGPRRFAEELWRFLDALPSALRGRMHVEVRTPSLLTEDLGAALRHAGASPGFVVHPEMPALEVQREAAGNLDRPVLIRWMLQQGRRYAEAKEAWAPFRDVQAPDPDARAQVDRLARTALEAGRSAMIIVNNKAEGCAPGSIEALARTLARISPSDATM